MIKVLFLTNSLGGGGAEKVLVNLANHMNKEIFDVSIKTFYGERVNLSGLSKDVKYSCTRIPYFKGITYFLKFIPARYLYKKIVGNEEYDVVVAFLHGISTKIVSGCKNNNIKRIAWLHYGDPKKGAFFKCWLLKKKAFKAYSQFDLIAGVSDTVTEAFKNYTHTTASIKTLYNVNDTDKIIELSEKKPEFNLDSSKYNVVSVGRLADQKGYDRLISASKRLIDEGYSFKITILGQGAERDNLQKQIQSNNLQSVLELTGYCENPYAIMKQADLFISSSREEGLATVLTEALTIGLPIVSTEVSGTREVLGNNEYGLVVENSEEGIYFGLKKALDDKVLMKKYASTAKERSILFDTAHTLKAVEEEIIKLCKN